MNDLNNNEIAIKLNIYEFEIEFINNKNNKPKKIWKDNKILNKLTKLFFIKNFLRLILVKLIKLIY